MGREAGIETGKKLYNDGFFDSLKQINLTQAKAIVPVIYGLADFDSIVDFGCGVGCWLKAFNDYGKLGRIHGLDGEWLRGKELLVDETSVEYTDLSKPIRLGEKYDLVVCVEVAEHLPETAADIFIDNLTLAGDLILFSAAIPWQGGTGHINEQWPDYWAAKFSRRGFVCFDVVRPLCWDNEAAGIYRQNLFLYVREAEKDRFPRILEAHGNVLAMRNLVAPFLYSTFMKKYTALLDTALLFVERESEGNGLAGYLRNKGIEEVAVYGMAEFGVTLTKYLLNQGFRVLCGIDKRQMEEVNGVSVCRPHELKGRKPKFVISTVPNAFEAICTTLSQIEGECEVIDIHSLLKEM